MTHEEKLAEYGRQRLAGRELPDDLRTLLVLQWQRDAMGAPYIAALTGSDRQSLPG